MNTINLHHRWVEDIGKRYASNIDRLVISYMPDWLGKMVENKTFGWVRLSKVWARSVKLEVRLGPRLRFTEVYIRGKFIGRIEY